MLGAKNGFDGITERIVRRSVIGLAAALAGCLLSAAGASADRAKIAGELLRAVECRQTGRVAIIVQTQGAPRAAELQRVRRLGGRVKQVFRAVPAFSAELPPGAVGPVSDL